MAFDRTLFHRVDPASFTYGPTHDNLAVTEAEHYFDGVMSLPVHDRPNVGDALAITAHDGTAAVFFRQLVPANSPNIPDVIVGP